MYKRQEVAHISKVKYLGYTFYRYKGKCRFRVHPKSTTKMKNKIRELTDRNNVMSNVKSEEKYQQFVRGWVNYFKLADMKKFLKEADEWARRRIRMVYWKQWKKIKTKYRMLKALGLEHWKAQELACSRKGYWRMAKVLNQIFSNKIIDVYKRQIFDISTLLCLKLIKVVLLRMPIKRQVNIRTNILRHITD